MPPWWELAAPQFQLIWCIAYRALCTWKCCPWRRWSPGSPCGSLLAASCTSWSRRLSHPHLAALYWPAWTCWASWPSGSRRGCSPWMAHFPGRTRARNDSLNHTGDLMIGQKPHVNFKANNASMSTVYLYLLDLSGQHAALDSQHGGDVDILPTYAVHPLGEAVHCGLKKFPGELYYVEDSLDDVVWFERRQKPY